MRNASVSLVHVFRSWGYVVGASSLLPSGVVVVFRRGVVVFQSGSYQEVLSQRCHVVHFPILGNLRNVFPTLRVRVVTIFSGGLFRNGLTMNAFRSLGGGPYVKVVRHIGQLGLLQERGSVLHRRFVLFLATRHRSLLGGFASSISNGVAFHFFLRHYRLKFLSLFIGGLLTNICFMFDRVQNRFRSFLVRFCSLFIGFVGVFSSV